MKYINFTILLFACIAIFSCRNSNRSTHNKPFADTAEINPVKIATLDSIIQPATEFSPNSWQLDTPVRDRISAFGCFRIDELWNTGDTLENFPLLEKPAGITFPVDTVSIARYPLRLYDAESVFSFCTGKKVSLIPEEHKSYGLIPSPDNGLMYALQLSFAQHRPLVLSPDIIWLTICQGVSIHVNLHSDSLLPTICKEEKPDIIEIRNDSLIAEKAVYWEQTVSDIANQAGEYIQEDFYSFFNLRFSSTTPIEQTSRKIVMLEALKQAFIYQANSGCGIPHITLTGTQDDWQAIYDNIDYLEQIGMQEWANELRPVIKQFIDIYNPNPDYGFWENIFKEMVDYDGRYINGWILKLFPYILQEPEYDQRLEVIEEYLIKFNYKDMFQPNPYIKGRDYQKSNLCLQDFPTGLAQIDILWRDYFNGTQNNDTIEPLEKQMELYAGFMGVKQYPDKTIEPLISWALTEKNAETYTGINTLYPIFSYPMHLWDPDVRTDLVNKAIYDKNRFKSAQESLKWIVENFEKSLKQFSSIQTSDSINLSFTVLRDGYITDLDVKTASPDSVKIKDLILLSINSLPEKWEPAYASPLPMLDEYNETDWNVPDIPYNSVIKLTLFKP